MIATIPWTCPSGHGTIRSPSISSEFAGGPSNVMIGPPAKSTRDMNAQIDGRMRNFWPVACRA